MQAVRFDRNGGPEVLYETTLPMPEIGAGHVLVQVHAASVNGADVHLRAGRLPFSDRRFPKQLGLDFVGAVVSAHPEADLGGLAVGDRVWGMVDSAGGARSLAEYVSVPAGQVARAPETLTANEAASLIAGGTTAYTGLVEKAGLRPGERVLVRGAAGGVGSVAVQLAKTLGGHVTALAGASSAEYVRELGADVVHDYRTTRLAGLGEFDVIFDAHGSDLFAVRRLLAPGGRMAAIAFDENAPVRSLVGTLATAVFGTRRIRFFSGAPTRVDFERLTAQVDRGVLRPVLDRAYPLAYAADAHAAFEASGVRSKLVIVVSET